MTLIIWPVVVLAAFSCGHLTVQFLTSPPTQMSKYLLGASFSAAIVVTPPLLLGVTGEFPGMAVGFISAAAFFLAGYWWATRRFLAREDMRPVPALTRAKEDGGLGHTAIIYFTHGEPATFDPIGWINQFREFDEQGIPFAPMLVRPWFVHKVRQKYLQIGKSSHRAIHERMFEALQQRYRRAEDQETRFYLCFLDDEPRPDAAVIEALNDGASRIVVAEVFLTISNHTAEGKEMIEAVGIDQYKVDVKYTGPMYDSEILKEMYVRRANARRGDIPKEETGILLVGHGQPDEWDEEWPTLTEQEIGFRQDILEYFADDGYRREHLGLAWMMFKEPKPAPKIEEWAGHGVSQVLYIPAAISAEAIHSEADIPELVEQARVPDGFPLINVGAWNDDPMTIDAIKAKIDAQLL